MKRLKVHTEIWISKTLEVSRELSNSQIILQKMQSFSLIWRFSTSQIVLHVTSIAVLLSDGCLFHRCNKHSCSLIWRMSISKMWQAYQFSYLRMSISQMWHACLFSHLGYFPLEKVSLPLSGDLWRWVCPDM